MAQLERQITVVAVVLPFLGFIAAIFLLWGGAVTGLDLAILAVMYVLVGFGVTIGFHRLFTHRSFEAKPWLRGTLAILGSMSVQGAVIHWVADHRKHHTFTDEEGDPHSPHTHGEPGWRGVLKGMWHSHMGWLFNDERSSARRFAPDLRKDPLIRKIDSLFPVWALLGLAIPFVLGFALSGGNWVAGVTAFVWAGLVRVFLLHHATWSVNSICHMYGKQPFSTKDESRNNWARRARVARRGLAPLAPRLPDVGAPWPPAPPVRPVVRADQAVREARLGERRQAPQARPDREEAPRRRRRAGAPPRQRPRARPRLRRGSASSPSHRMPCVTDAESPNVGM